MKAILVIDMPSCCHTCRLEHYGLCMGTLERKTIVNDSTMPDYCPLKPMPKEINSSMLDEVGNVVWECGWNACLKAIENGETKEGDIEW